MRADRPIASAQIDPRGGFRPFASAMGTRDAQPGVTLAVGGRRVRAGRALAWRPDPRSTCSALPPCSPCSPRALTSTARRSSSAPTTTATGSGRRAAPSATRSGVVGSSMMVLMLLYSRAQAGAGAAPAGPARPLAGRPHLPGRLRPAAGRAPQQLQGAGARGPELLVDGRRRLERRPGPLPLPADPAHARRRGAAPWRSSRRRTASSPSGCARASASTRPSSRGSTRWWRSRPRAGPARRLRRGSSRTTCGCARRLRAFARELPLASRGPSSRVRAGGAAEGPGAPPHPALGPRARALPLLARAPQAVRRGDVPLHDRPRRGGARDRLRLGRAGREAAALALGARRWASSWPRPPRAPRSRPGR